MNSQDSISSNLADSIQSGLLAAAEIGSNHLLALDDQVMNACSELQGRCIAIEVSDLGFTLYCHPGNWGIRLSRNPPAREVDACISGRVMALINLATLEDKISTSMQERVSFQGDVALAQKLQKIIGSLDIDWEEALSRHTGDLLAHQIHLRVRKAATLLQQTADSLLQNSSDYLREEARLTPTRVEFDRFAAEATELKHRVDYCQARLQHLLDKRSV